jgi:hypothetical protein
VIFSQQTYVQIQMDCVHWVLGLFLAVVKHIAAPALQELTASSMAPQAEIAVYVQEANTLPLMGAHLAQCAQRISTPIYLAQPHASSVPSLRILLLLAQVQFWIAEFKPVPVGRE